jgi:hypothetical protein
LGYVKRVWASIVSGRYQNHVDEQTVSELELLAPAVSSRDRVRATKLMEERKIFCTLQNEAAREEILQNILVQDRLIPSLRTFFEDQKYLEPCSLVLKSLLDDSEKRPLWRAFSANYWHPSTVQLQYAEGSGAVANLVLSGDIDEKSTAMKLAYLQLWLFCIRHFPELTDIKPRIESRKKIRIRREYDLARLQQLGCLAVKLGFRTKRATQLAVQAAEWTNATSERMRSPIRPIVQEFPFTSGYYSPRERRCGRPYDDDHDNDQAAIFTFMFYSPISSGDLVTPLLVKRNIFEAFLRPFIPPVSVCAHLPTLDKANIH